MHSVDHLVLPTASISQARRRLESLGFTVAADAVHPFGTENACVFFADGTYLEPLGVRDVAACHDAARAGNVFVARDAAFRLRCGQEGLSAIAIRSENATADHEMFRSKGLSGGAMLDFSRDMLLPDGTKGTGGFRLAFASELRAPDFFLFTCQRINPLPSDRAALERHDNGVTGIARIVLCEPEPGAFAGFLQVAFSERTIEAIPGGIEVRPGKATVSIFDPATIAARYGVDVPHGERGLKAQAVVFPVGDLSVTGALLAGNGVRHERRDGRILVPATSGQGVVFVFEEMP